MTYDRSGRSHILAVKLDSRAAGLKLLLCAIPQSRLALYAVYRLLCTIAAQPFPSFLVGKRPTGGVR